MQCLSITTLLSSLVDKMVFFLLKQPLGIEKKKSFKQSKYASSYHLGTEVETFQTKEGFSSRPPSFPHSRYRRILQ